MIIHDDLDELSDEQWEKMLDALEIDLAKIQSSPPGPFDPFDDHV